MNVSEVNPMTARQQRDNAIRIRRAIDHFDIESWLPQVTVPTLVIHSRHDSVHPLSQGRLLASCIPGARLMVLESHDHILLPRNPIWSDYIDAVMAYIGCKN